MTSRYPRGSEWRRWDLHVHTPHSLLNNGFGNDFDRYAEGLFRRAVEREIAVIGVTDYFVVTGYRELTARAADDQWLAARFDAAMIDRIRKITLLPNLELRLFVVRDDEGGDSRTNYHVLFSNELSSEDIEEHFLRRLQFTSAAGPGRADERLPLTAANLTALGARLKEQHAPFRDRSDLEIGMTTALVNHEDITEILTSDRRFHRHYLLVAPGDEDLSDIPWDNQGHMARKLAIQKAHMLFSANANTRSFGLGLKHVSPEAFAAEFESIKPCIHGSDAHDDAHLFEPDHQRYLWVKADPTWYGLRQLLNEPSDRVYIGPVPPQLADQRSRLANTVRDVSIAPVDGGTYDGSWFDVEVPLNPGLAAVIGHRGSGKSALAEIVALLGNTSTRDAFSFLTGDRFRNTRDDVARRFEGSLTWADGTPDEARSLAQDPPPSAVERIAFIGQGYLERVCNEIVAGSDSQFHAELEKVIFSHVSVADRQGFTTLRDLLTHLADQEARSIDQSLNDVRSAVRDVLISRARLKPAYRESLRSQLAEVERQIAAHDQQRPAAVPPPRDVVESDELISVRNQLQADRASLAAVEQEINDLRAEDAAAARRQTSASRLIGRLSNLRTYVDGQLAEAREDATALGLDIATVVTFELDLNPVQTIATQIAARRAEIARATNEAVAGSAASRRRQLVASIDRLNTALTAPEAEYERYRSALATWEETRAALIGDPGTPASQRAIEAAIQSLDSEPARLRAAMQRRRRAALEIFRHKNAVRLIYARYHEPVADFLRTNPIARTEGFGLTFDATIQDDGAAATILQHVDRRRVGPFAGIGEGAAALDDLVSRTDWESARAAVRFAERVESTMLSSAGRSLNIEDQLVQSMTVEDFLSALFGFDYLAPAYELRWAGRGLGELSPGERGNLLLIFYLLVDRSTIPLVIDQPEENLDNETIVKTLVPCLRDARLRRQLLIVTHNPNLAVVCDADQVVCADMDKSSGNRAQYVSGSIEDPEINHRIVDILEGTMAAFDGRARKYLERLAIY